MSCELFGASEIVRVGRGSLLLVPLGAEFDLPNISVSELGMRLHRARIGRQEFVRVDRGHFLEVGQGLLC